MTQLDLTLPPATHRYDPATSHEALESIDRETDLYAVLEAVRDHPRKTGSELAHILGWPDVYRVRRRLSDLHNMDRIQRGESRVAAGRSRSECEWEAR